MIKLNIDVTKIDKTRIHEGKKGKYLDLVLVDHPSDYGDGFIAHDVSKEERNQGVKGTIIGNWKRVGGQREQREQPQQRPPAPKRQPPTGNEDFEDPPF